MTSQKIINARYAEYRDAGDDGVNAGLRLMDFDGITPIEVAIARVAYGDCACCGDDEDGTVDQLCADCRAVGLTYTGHGNIACPTCGGNFLTCPCSAPDSACG